MKINNKSMKTSTIFDLEDGDIFLFEDAYYIASDIDWCSHLRTCYNLNINSVRNFTVNREVVAWDRNECELNIR